MSRNFSYLLPTAQARVASALSYAEKRMRALGLDPANQADVNQFNRVRIVEQSSYSPAVKAQELARLGLPIAEQPPEAPRSGLAAPARPPTGITSAQREPCERWLGERGFVRDSAAKRGDHYVDDASREAYLQYGGRGVWVARWEGMAEPKDGHA